MKPISKIPCLGLTLAVLAAAGFPVKAQNLLVNGGFEDGSFAGWTITPAAFGSELAVTSDPNKVQAGSYAAAFSEDDGIADTLSQTFATTPGKLYQIDYWLKTLEGGYHFAQLESAFGSQPLQNLDHSFAGFYYTEFTYETTATGFSTTLSFTGSTGDNIDLDTVSVVKVASGGGNPYGNPVPDGGMTIGLLGSALAGLAALRRQWA